jgi:hypothetical protein
MPRSVKFAGSEIGMKVVLGARGAREGDGSFARDLNVRLSRLRSSGWMLKASVIPYYFPLELSL